MNNNFNKEYIGKFILAEDLKIIITRSIFYPIIGYDYYKEKYLFFDGFKYSELKNNIKIYSYAEAIEYINVKSNENIKSSICLQEVYNKIKLAKDNCSGINHKNELIHLMTSYNECIKQKEVLKKYYLHCSARDMYEREFKRTEKAIRRLDKRFYYYFGDSAKEIQNFSIKYKNIIFIKDLINQLDKENIKLEKEKNELLSFYEKFKEKEEYICKINNISCCDCKPYCDLKIKKIKD